MSLRLVQVFTPHAHGDTVVTIIETHSALTTWRDRLSEGRCLINVLLPTGDTEKLIDDLEKSSAGVDGFRVILLPVEASIPRPETKRRLPDGMISEAASAPKVHRVSREELYTDVNATTRFTRTFLAFVILYPYDY